MSDTKTSHDAPTVQWKTDTGGDSTRAVGADNRPTVVTTTMAGGAVAEGEAPAVEGYTLTRLLGRGGMGEVYEAVQQATGRRVALKFMTIAVGTAGAEAARKRFEREVELVARLQHPAIVSVLDSGVRKGAYWYAMDFVEGVRLDEVMAPGKCDPDRALRLVADIADAVDYAHQRGVLHRDLKPSNIIVDANGAPHVLDFGLAKSIEGEQEHRQQRNTLSEAGQIMGTLAYMSPEQAQGDMSQTSVRTDVYTLGAIAYELITGRVPIDVEGPLHEVLRRIIHDDPPRATSVRAKDAPGRIDADVDAILAKSVERDPAKRYPTVGAMAADIRRYLADEPVEARVVGSAGRFVRLVRRNRAVSTVVATAALVLIVSSSAFVWRILEETRRANKNAEDAIANADRANRSADEAKANLKLATENEQLATRNAQEATDTLNYYVRMIRTLNPERAAAVSVKEMLRDASRQLDAADSRVIQNPRVELKIRESLGEALTVADAYREAWQNLLRAVEIREQLRAAGDPAGGTDAELAQTIHNAAVAKLRDSDYDGAKQLYERSLAIRRAIHTGDHEDLAMSYTHLGAVELQAGRIDMAEWYYTEALAMRERLAGGKKSDRVAASINNLAKYYQEAGRLDESEALFRRALNMIEEIAGKDDFRVATASINLSACLRRAGKLEDARLAAQRGLDIRELRYEPRHSQVALACVTVAEIALDQRSYDEALKLADRAIDILNGVFAHKPDHIAFARPLLVRGLVRVATNDPRRALADLERASEIAEAAARSEPRLARDTKDALEKCKQVIAAKGP